MWKTERIKIWFLQNIKIKREKKRRRGTYGLKKLKTYETIVTLLRHVWILIWTNGSGAVKKEFYELVGKLGPQDNGYLTLLRNYCINALDVIMALLTWFFFFFFYFIPILFLETRTYWIIYTNKGNRERESWCLDHIRRWLCERENMWAYHGNKQEVSLCQIWQDLAFGLS